MHFWDLPEDIFLEILAFIGSERGQGRQDILKSLRLTSKRFAKFVDPGLFSAVAIKLDGSDLTSRVALASRLGHFVKTLTLSLWVDSEKDEWRSVIGIDNRDTQVSQIIRLVPNVHDLTLHILRDSRLRLPKVTLAFEEMKMIRSLQVMETLRRSTGSEPFTQENVSDLLDGIVAQIFQSSGKELQHLSFDTKSCISTPNLKLLRAEASSLRAAIFRNYIGITCRDILCEDTPWACRDSLQYLSFLDCRGAHSGAIACGVANGLWARNLQWLEVSTCGKMDDVARLPYPLAPSDVTPPVSLERAHYEHEIYWELDFLGKIPVKNLTLTKVEEQEVITLLEAGAFPCLEKLEIDSTVDMQTSKGISDACERRKVKLILEASPSWTLHEM